MPFYKAIKPALEAHQWFENGDHPMDLTINRINEGAVVKRHPTYKTVQGGMLCKTCNKPMGVHGKMLTIGNESAIICPGDYIEFIRNDKGRILGYEHHEKKLFEETFEKIIVTGVKK